MEQQDMEVRVLAETAYEEQICGSYVPPCSEDSSLSVTGYFIYGEKNQLFTSMNLINVLFVNSDCNNTDYYSKTRYVYGNSNAPSVEMKSGVPVVTLYAKASKCYVAINTDRMSSSVTCNNPISKGVEFDVETNVCIDKNTGKDILQEAKNFIREAVTERFVFTFNKDGSITDESNSVIQKSGDYGCNGIVTDPPNPEKKSFWDFLKSPLGIVACVVVLVIIIMIIFMLCHKSPSKKLPKKVAAAKKYGSQIDYSEKYYDDTYEYRHVTIPKELVKQIPRGKLLSTKEWRLLGIQMSCGWEHYATHIPEPQILLFRRPLGTDGNTGKVNPEIAKIQREQYRAKYGVE